jgi:GTPase SAR1 family protein
MNNNKVIVLGDVGVGKTSILGRYKSNKFELNHPPSYSATLITKR